MYFDIACLIIICFAALMGIIKGFLSQVISLIVMVVSLACAFWLSEPFSAFIYVFLGRAFPHLAIDPTLVTIITGVCVFALFYFLLGTLLESIKKRMTESVSMKISDRFFGMIIGAAKGAAFVLLLIALLNSSQDVISRFTSPEGFDSYQDTLHASGAYPYGNYLIDEACKKWPAVSNTVYNLRIPLPETTAETTEQ